MAPSTGALHWQCYFQFSKRIGIKPVKRELEPLFKSDAASAHIERARGSPDDNIAYCSKFESRYCDNELVYAFRMGEPVYPRGNATSTKPIVLLGERVRSGESLVSIASDPTFDVLTLPYMGSLSRWKHLLHPTCRDPSVPTICRLYFGAPGTGKTRLAFQNCPEAYSKPSGDWWDFYDGQSQVIFDDFAGHFCRFNDLKRWIDRYPCLVQYKGGFTPLLATEFIITTNSLPGSWYAESTFGHLGLEALWRRITHVVYFRDGGIREEFDDAVSISVFRQQFAHLDQPLKGNTVQ